MVTQPRAFALHLPRVRSQWVLGHMSQCDDGGGDSTNIIITSSLHLIKLLNESQPYAYAPPAPPLLISSFSYKNATSYKFGYYCITC